MPWMLMSLRGGGMSLRRLMKLRKMIYGSGGCMSLDRSGQ
uniref:Uncharacterized protein n=1 Tax=Arundo donax TaxID=35708 RepID=A0A0A9GG18_ARUDO